MAGGGTGGPVTPLIAVMQELKKRHNGARFLIAGNKSGLEKEFSRQYGIQYANIPAGKFRRYFSFADILAPFLVFAGFIKSIFVIRKFKPDLIFGAGGFVSVPVMFAAFLMRKKILVHQQDSRASLTNRLVAPLADKITVAFQSSLKDFSSGSGLLADSNKQEQKILWTGNPVRQEFLQKFTVEEIISIKKENQIDPQMPVILILGGATGASSLNSLILQILPKLTAFSEIIHLTGKNKRINFQNAHYRQYEMSDGLAKLYAISNIVICRAGLGTITELSATGKPAIAFPMPQSHQLENGQALAEANAAIVLDQTETDGETLLLIARKLMYDGDWQKEISANVSKLMPKDAAEKIAAQIEQLCPE